MKTVTISRNAFRQLRLMAMGEMDKAREIAARTNAPDDIAYCEECEKVMVEAEKAMYPYFFKEA